MKRRSLVTITILSIITLGLYGLYWVFVTRDELVKKGEDVPSPWIFVGPLLALLGIAVLQIIAKFTGLGDNAQAGINVLSALVGFFAVIAVLPLSIYWVYKYSKAVDSVTKGKLDSDTCLAMALVLNVLGFGFIWPIVVQHYYNEL